MSFAKSERSPTNKLYSRESRRGRLSGRDGLDKVRDFGSLRLDIMKKRVWGVKKRQGMLAIQITIVTFERRSRQSTSKILAEREERKRCSRPPLTTASLGDFPAEGGSAQSEKRLTPLETLTNIHLTRSCKQRKREDADREGKRKKKKTGSVLTRTKIAAERKPEWQSTGTKKETPHRREKARMDIATLLSEKAVTKGECGQCGKTKDHRGGLRSQPRKASQAKKARLIELYPKREGVFIYLINC